MKYKLLAALCCVGVWQLSVQGAEPRLLEASRSGQTAELQVLLAAGADPDTTFPVAAHRLQVLLGEKSVPAARAPLLWFAVQSGTVATVRALLQSGAEPDGAAQLVGGGRVPVLLYAAAGISCPSYWRCLPPAPALMRRALPQTVAESRC